MKICPRCNFYNQDKNKRCLKCGWTLEPTKDLKDLPDVSLELRSNPIHRFTRFFRMFFRRVGRFFGSEIPKAPYRYPYLAAGLSLFFGLGQVYNRQYKKAVFFFLGYLIGLCIVIPTLTKPYSNWLILLFIAYALYTYNDGLVTALKINGQQWTFRYTLAAYSALFFVLGLGTILGQFFLFAIFKLIRVTQPTLEPVIHERDMVYVDCLAFKFRKPKRGEIVFYTPEPFFIEVPAAYDTVRYFVHEKRTFERIMGLPGDIVERKEGRFYLNGKPMPPWCVPLLPDNIHANMRFEVPEKHYLVIFSHSPREAQWGPSFGGTAPRLNAPGVILDGWDKACLVKKKQIFGRAIFIMNPPVHRRFLQPAASFH